MGVCKGVWRYERAQKGEKKFREEHERVGGSRRECIGVEGSVRE